jgi:nucleoside-diphosphate-sugar epimerase
MWVVLVGVSGFVGRGLRSRLAAAGHNVSVIGRGRSDQHADWEAVTWDARSVGAWAASLETADVIVHMAGKRVDCRPTKTEAVAATILGSAGIAGERR